MQHSIILSVVLLGFVSAAPVAVASEVTGTLSSDGSAATDQGTMLNETNTGDTEVRGQVAQQSDGQLQGEVVGGRENSAALSEVDATSWGISAWMFPAGAALVGGLIFLLWRRNVV